MSLAQNHYIVKLPVTPQFSRAVDVRSIAQQWITNLESLLSNGEYPRLSELFQEDSWWRDMLAFEWDLHTIQNRSAIQEFLHRNQPRSQLSGFRLQHEGKFQPRLEKPATGLSWISSMFFFETRVGRGTGVLRLTQNEDGAWRAYAMYTSLQELKDFEEPLGSKRPEGTIESMPGGLGKGNWQERRQRKIEFLDEEPATLIVGAGMYSSDTRSSEHGTHVLL